MVSINWNNPVDGNWSDAADWSTGTRPTAADDVTIAAAGKYTVAITTPDAANSLTLDDVTATLQESATGSLALTGALTIDNGVAELDGTNSIPGGITLNGGILEVGNARALGAGPLTIDGGLLLGTVNETLTNALQLNGSIAIAAATGTTLNLDSTTPWTLTNGSSIVFGPAGQDGTVIWHGQAGAQISDEGGVTIEVAGGTLKAGDDHFTFLFFNDPETLVDASATIDLAGHSVQIVNLQGTGTVTDSGAAATLNLANSDFAGTLSGALSLDLLGPVTLTGTNTYTGTTTLAINKLTLGDGGTTGSIAGQSAITDDTSLIFDRSNAYVVANVISGTGSVQQIGTGTTTLTAANSYSGGTTITAGTLVAANASALGTGPVNLANAELLATTDVTIASLTLSGNVTLAAAKGVTLDIDPSLTLSLTQASGDTLTFGAPGEDGTVIWTPPALSEVALNGTIDLDTLVVQDGTLKGAVAPGNPAVDELPTNIVLQTIVDAAGTIDVAGAQDQINDLQGTGTVTDSVGGGTVTLDGGDFAGTISGNLNVVAMGTVELTGTNTYKGSTTIDGGATLTLGGGGSSGSLAAAGAVIDDGALIFFHSNALSFGNPISGSGTVVQVGTGTTTLTGANTYTGGTTIAAGTLAVSNASALGTGSLTIAGGELLGTATETLTNTLTLSGAETIAAAAGTTLTLDSANPWTLSGASLTFGAPGQNGVVTWHTPSSETFGGFVQTIDVAAGTLRVGDANINALTMSASQTIVEAGATIDLDGFSTDILDLDGRGTVTDSGAATLLQISGNIVAGSIYQANFAGMITGALDLIVSGPVTLTGTNTYTGTTTINLNSTLTLGNGGTSGSILASSSVIDDGTLALDYSDALTFANVISGTGSVQQIGTGTTALTAANTYTGGTTIQAGTLIVGQAAELGTGPLTITGGELLGTASETLTNTLNFGGGTIAAATGTTLTLNSGNPFTLTGNTVTFGAAGQNGVVIWHSPIDEISGGIIQTVDVAAGTLEAGDANFSALTNSTLRTIVAAGATIDLAGFSAGFLNLEGSGAVTDSGAAAVLQIRGDLNGESVFSGMISGPLALNLFGAVTLTGADTYTGSTTINLGSSLTLGNGGTTGSIASADVIDNGTLVFDRSDAVNFGNVISGSGAVIQAGTGTTTLANTANTYSGGTTITAGTLAIGSGAELGSGTLTIDGGELLGTGIETISDNLALSGSIKIAAAHGGLLILDPSQVDATGLTELTIGSPGQDGIVLWDSLVQPGLVGPSGTLDVRDGTLEVESALLYTQTTVEAGATIDIGGAPLSNNQISLGKLKGAGTVNGNGQPVTLYVTGGTDFSGTLSGAFSLELGGNVTLGGTTEVADGTTFNALLFDFADLTNTGTFILDSDAGVQPNRAAFLTSFVNDGLFEKTGGTGTSQVSVPFTNNGTIAVTSGSIDFTGGLNNIGIIEGQLSGTTVSADPVGETFFYGGTGSNHFTVTTAPTLISCAPGGTNTVEVAASLTFAAGSLVNVQDVQVDNGVTANFSQLTTGENIISESTLGGGATIIGTQGNDVITAGVGADVLTGGAGADTFILGPGALATALTGAPDTITDYDQGGGHYNATQGDQIELAGLLAPQLVQDDPFSSLVRLVEDKSGTFASLQINPNGVAGHWIDLAHLDGLVAGETVAIFADQLSSLTVETVESVACYCLGTLIRTETCDMPVETLAIGDKLMTSSGKARAIKWIGRRSYGGRFIMGRKDILPIRFKAGSLADNVPRRDLWISPHHAMYFEHQGTALLIEAKDLVNGSSIVQADHVDDVDYFHIELETHDVIIAEGALSETFIDDGSRGMFQNANEYDALYPDAVPTAAHYCAPRLDEGYAVEAIRRHLALRAGLRAEQSTASVGPLRGYVDRIGPDIIEGWAQNTAHPETPVCLDVYAGGSLIGQVLAGRYREDLESAGIGSGHHSFSFTPPDGLRLSPGTLELRRSLDGAPLFRAA